MSGNGMKRYNLVIPEDLFDQVETIAESRKSSVVDVFRQFIKLGLLLTDVEKSPDASILIREGEREREIVLL